MLPGSAYLKIMTKILCFKGSLIPSVAIFGFSTERSPPPGVQSDILAFTSLLAGPRILLLWKSSKPPSVTSWLRDVIHFLKLEKIRFTMKGNTAAFYAKWNFFLLYFNALQVIPAD